MAKLTMTRGEFDRFWDTVLGDSWAMNEFDIPDSVWESKDPTRVMNFESVEIYWSSDGEPQPNEWITGRDLDVGFLNFFDLVRRWRAGQKAVTATVEVPAEKLPELRQLVAKIGGIVTSPEEG